MGVIIDSKMNWAAHIETVSKRTRKLIHVSKNLKSVVDEKLLVQIII